MSEEAEMAFGVGVAAIEAGDQLVEVGAAYPLQIAPEQHPRKVPGPETGRDRQMGAAGGKRRVVTILGGQHRSIAEDRTGCRHEAGEAAGAIGFRGLRAGIGVDVREIDHGRKILRRCDVAWM